MAELDFPVPYSHGALFIGWTLATMMYGLTCSQTTIYFKRYLRDHIHLRSTVVLLWFLETLHIILVSYSSYQYLVALRGQPDALVEPIWSIKVQLIPASMVVGTVQYIWVMRVWSISHNRWRTHIAYVMLLLIVGDWIISITYLADIMNIRTFPEATQRLWHIAMAIMFTTLTDLVTTTSFCYVAHRSRDGLPSTNTLINKLIVYGINTGIVTVIGTVGLLIALLVAPRRLYYIGLYMVLPQLYLNTHLAMLNSRRSSRPAGAETERTNRETSLELTTIPLATMSRYTDFQYP